MSTDPTQDPAPPRATAPPTLAPTVLLATGTADAYTSFDGPLGPVWVAWNDHGVCWVRPAGDAEAYEAACRTRTGRPLFPVRAAPARLARRIERALASGRLGDLPVDLRTVGPFHADALRVITGIEPGQVRSYRWVAEAVGRPGATRAVGTAMARNPVPLLVPCHRVVRTDGAIGQYSMGGPVVKRRLLEREGALPRA